MQWAMHGEGDFMFWFPSFLSHSSWGWTPCYSAFCQVKGLDGIGLGWCWWREGYKRRAKSAFQCWGRRLMALLCGWCPVKSSREHRLTWWGGQNFRNHYPQIPLSVSGFESLCVGHSLAHASASRTDVTLHPISFPLEEKKKLSKPGLDLTPSTSTYKL